MVKDKKYIKEEKKIKKNIKNNLKNKQKGKIVSKKTVKTSFDFDKLFKSKNFYIGLGVYLVILLVLYFMLGFIISFVLTTGSFLILIIGNWVSKLDKKSKSRKIINILAILGLIGCVLASIGVIFFLYYVINTAPVFDTKLLNNKESSILYASNGQEFAKLGAELRENVSYDDLPQVFIDALVATEDSRFFQHNGLDAPRFTKAAIGQVLGNDSAGGGSTLSMQVIKNSFTSGIDTGMEGIIRKFTDIYLAVFKLERNYTKEQIIEFYVNNHSLGGTIFGVEEASQAYFGKSIKNVTLTEAALLAGMFKAPTTFNPLSNPNASSNRRATVLNLMVRHGYISQEESDIAKKIPVESIISEKDNRKTLEHQAYVDAVIEELKDKHGINIYTTPILVYTNLDIEKQKSMNSIFNGETYKWQKQNNQAGVAVTDPQTGKILALGAGRNRTGARTYNFATMATRQIGSTAKPIFDYAPGIELNNWSTYEQFVDEPWSYSTGQAINNSDSTFSGQISLRLAISVSKNIPALKAFQSLDNKKAIEFVRSLGMKPEVSNGYMHEAHSLGAYKGATPLEMAAAYAAFANGGYYIEPTTLSKVVYRTTKQEIVITKEKKQVMSDATAFMITDMLRTSVTSGLAGAANIPGVYVAAKTGTTNFTDADKKTHNLPYNAVNDSWVVGYSPDAVISMWYGFENISKGYNTVIEAAVQRTKLYQALGKSIFPKTGNKFTPPSSVTKVGVEIGSKPALLPSENTPEDQIVYEYFKTGTEPTQVSSKYLELKPITNLTGTYVEDKSQLILRWTGIPTPVGSESYGPFGYKVYFNNTLIDFTTETTFTVDTKYPNGVYKVVAAFRDFNGNQSKPVLITIKDGSELPPEGKYSSKLNGQQFVTIDIGDVFKDQDPPVTIIDLITNLDITNKVIADKKIKTIIKTSDNRIVTSITTDVAMVYTITYEINYDSYIKKYTRTVTVK